LLAAYPCPILDPTAGYRQFIAIFNDAFFNSPSRRALRGAALTQTEPVYRYLYTHGLYGGPAMHGQEVPFVFGTFAAAYYGPSPAEQALSDELQSYWVNFAATGNPNGDGLPTWSAYNPAADNALTLDTTISDTSGVDAAGCNLWDTLE
jgi:para-nitrobenzyl esterase